MSDQSRRSFIQIATTATLAAAVAAPRLSAAEAVAGPVGAAPTGGAFGAQLTPTPLPFDPKKLNGLSEKLLQSHWENNYGGAVKALNTLRGRLSQALADANTPAYVYNGLKREQLIRTGSVVLHDLYFANLGGSGAAGADLRTRISASFGSFDTWESEFRKIGQGLGGGSGWVVLGFNRKLRLLENYWMADHSTGPVDVAPVLVMDMYEHAFAMDYGAAAAKYIDAFFTNIQWDAVAKRLEQGTAPVRA
jgi:superoxide dismutase, Fe-Mn family